MIEAHATSRYQPGSAKKLLLVATDGRRLARRKLNLLSGPAETGYRIIVPAKTMSLLDRIGGVQGAGHENPALGCRQRHQQSG